MVCGRQSARKRYLRFKASDICMCCRKNKKVNATYCEECRQRHCDRQRMKREVNRVIKTREQLETQSPKANQNLTYK